MEGSGRGKGRNEGDNWQRSVGGRVNCQAVTMHSNVVVQ